MSTEQDNGRAQDPSQRAGNVTSEARTPFGEYVGLVLGNEHLDGIQASDCILGAIIARGPVEGKLDVHTPEMTITLMDKLGKVTNQEGYAKAISDITKQEGLRKTVFDMSNDLKFGPVWGHLAERAGYNPNVTAKGMGSLDMVGAYLDVRSDIAAAEHSKGRYNQASYDLSWKSVILDQVNLAVKNPGQPWDKDSDLSASKDDYLRQKGNEFNDALNKAQSAGVNVELIRQTVERLRTLHAQEVSLGGEAIAHVRAAEFDRNIIRMLEDE